MDHILHDCIESLRPKLRIAQTLDEVSDAIEKIEFEAMEKLEQMGFQVCEKALFCRENSSRMSKKRRTDLVRLSKEKKTLKMINPNL